MNKLFKKLFAPIAILSIALGVTVSLNVQKNEIKAQAATYTQITAASQITSGKKYVITTNRYNTTTYQYLPRFNSTSNAAVATTFTNIADLADTATWIFTSVAGGWEISQSGIKLYSTATNNGLRSSSSPSSGNVWTITDSAADYGTGRLNIKNNLPSPRYITLFQSADWRSYTTVYTSAADQEGNLVLYELQESTAVLQSISVTNAPTKTIYFEGDNFDKSGMVVTATYDSAPSADVTSAVVVSPSPLLITTTSVSLSYTEGGVTKTTTQAITVNAVVLSGISIKTSATKTTFAFGEPFNYDGLVITATYNNGPVDLVSGFVVSGINTKILGQQMATVSYNDQTTSYLVTVTNQGANIGTVFATNLIISEYIEGSSNDKAIEIFNGTGSTIDLANYSLKIGANGGAWSTNPISLTGTLAHNSTYVVANTSANPNILALTNLSSGSLTHNGDDAIGLFSGSDLVDIFGVQGTDPGTGWTMGELTNATVDHVIVRKSSIIQPNSNWNPSEWDIFDNNTLSYLGNHTMTLNSLSELEQATAFANYVMTGKGLNAEGECEAVLTNLQAEFGFMVEDAQLEFETNPATVFVNARARMAYFEAWVGVPAGQISRPESTNTTRNNLFAVITIGAIGLTSILAYYFIDKKKASR